MAHKGFIIMLAAAFLVPLNAEAQLGSKLKQKLGEKLNEALEREATAGKEDTLNEEASAGQAQEGSFDLTKLGIGKVTAKYDQSYDFRGMMQMKTEIYDKGKPEGTMDSEIWFNTGNSNIGMESRTITDDEGQSLQATAIIDAVNKVMITFAVMEGGKTGMIMPIPDSADEGEMPEAENDVTVRKTGETKTICGYRCEGYEITEDKGKVVSNVWATEELKLHVSQKLYGNQKGMPRNFGMASVKGAVMASETYEKGKLATKSEVTKVDLKASYTISTAGVSLMQMDMGK